MKKTTILTVALNVICAVIWLGKAVADIERDSPILVAGDVICAVIWLIACVVHIKRDYSNKDE